VGVHGRRYRGRMSRYAAFLRGMNVGGHRLTNDELRERLQALGLRDVVTFRASGNVVFTGGRSAPEQLRRKIEAGLADGLGYAVPTFIRTAPELLEIAARRPFTAEVLAASRGKLQVAMLERPPTAPTRRQIVALAGDGERLAFGKCELYWLPSAGVLESGLDMQSIERTLGTMTMRTMGTIEQIAARHFAD